MKQLASLLIFTLLVFQGYTQSKKPVYRKGNTQILNLLKENIEFPTLELDAMNCGYALAILELDSIGNIDTIYTKSKLGVAFDTIVLNAVSKFENFSPYHNDKKEKMESLVVQPIGFLYDDRVCPAWTKLEEDSNYVKTKEIFYLSEYTISRDSRTTADALYRKKGQLLVDQGKYKEAIPLFAEGLSFEPENDFYAYHLGICYYHIRDLNNACKYLKQAKKLGNKIAKSVYKEKCDY